MRTLADADQDLADYKAEVERRDEIIASETALRKTADRDLAEAKDRLCHAFLAGAKWWEWKKTNATMWQSDQNEVFAEALNRYPFLSLLERGLRRELEHENALNAQQAERIRELECALRPYESVVMERQAQDTQWGGHDHDDTHSWEDWKRYVIYQASRLKWQSVAANRLLIRERFVKIAALAVAAIESIDRKQALAAKEPACTP